MTFDFWTLEPDDDADRHTEEVTSTLKQCLGENTIGPQSDPLLANSVALITGLPDVNLASLQRLLTDSAYREAMIAHSRNEYAKRYFREVFPKLGKGATRSTFLFLFPTERIGAFFYVRTADEEAGRALLRSNRFHVVEPT